MQMLKTQIHLSLHQSCKCKYQYNVACFVIRLDIYYALFITSLITLEYWHLNWSHRNHFISRNSYQYVYNLYIIHVCQIAFTFNKPYVLLLLYVKILILLNILLTFLYGLTVYVLERDLSVMEERKIDILVDILIH